MAMMGRRLLPALGVRDTGPGTPRVKQKFPVLPGEGKSRAVTVPDEVVAGIKWLIAEGLVHPQIRAFYPGLGDPYFSNVRDEILRKHIQPKCPSFIDETAWRERFRFPRGTQP